ncbi:MAG: hypothetical protein WAO19_07915 [Candidatus Kryptoniota bacterium]
MRLHISTIRCQKCFFIVFLFSLSAIAQPQVVNFKQLQQFLPQGNFGNYSAEQPTGETSTMMGFSTSWAQVNYHSSTDSSAVSARITDLLNIPSYMSIAPPVNSDSIRSTPVGYEKTVMYKDLKIMETYHGTTHRAKLQSYFANRFLLEINGENVSDTNVLYGLLDKINLDGLRALIQPSQINNGK